MANVLFCSDLHFGHRNIHKMREFTPLSGVDKSEESHRELIKHQWKERVTKRDTVYVLGDAVFTEETIGDFSQLPGEKRLIRGNHDCLPTSEYLKYFSEVYGLLKYKEFWLSHAPIHPEELRGKTNLHGHVHYATLPDSRYFNCCPENLWTKVGSCLVSLDEIRKMIYAEVH